MIVAGLVVLIWDHAITMSQEVKIMWTRPVTVQKAIYFFLRYGVTGGQLIEPVGLYRIV